MDKIQRKCDQTAKSVAGYKWSQKVAIFGMVKEKGQTYRVTFEKSLFRLQVFGKYCMKKCKKPFQKQLNNSVTCTYFLSGYHGYMCKVDRTNVAALATGHNHYSFMKRIASVLSEPASTFSVVKFSFLRKKHHSERVRRAVEN